ncbi:MAG: BrnT family toxin [bacterium]
MREDPGHFYFILDVYENFPNLKFFLLGSNYFVILYENNYVGNVLIYKFDWNKIKALTNLQKHKVSFQSATGIFNDPNALTIYDDEHSDYEDRWITLGLESSGIILVVIHTFSELDNDVVNIRIISARKATKNEVKLYNGE